MSLKPGSEEHRRLYAAFAKSAYGHQTQIPEGYMIDPEFSNRNRQVWINPQTRHAVLAHRGTIPGMNSRGVADLSTDAALAAGLEWATPRFNNAVKYGKKVKDKYGKDFKYTATGHSLGGSQALYLQKRLGMEAVTFSAHTPTRRVPDEALASILGFPRNTKGLTNYTTAYDPIGLGTLASYYPARNTFVVPQTSKGAHDLDNFL